MLLVISLVRLIYNQRIYVIVPPTLCFFIFAILHYIKEIFWGFHFTIAYRTVCNSQMKADIIGMISFFSNVGFNITIVPFLFIHRFFLLVVYYVLLASL